ncbi:Patatin [Rhynchospora pubera]|uniref:Patatin n=1 Tax=Rhynchospora pubera TaxID=906938 RepID=A0AAV8D7W5_9POAL|nr:Patatin [Rhynchospora pubera]
MKPRHLLPFSFSRASVMSALCSLFSLLPKSPPSIPTPSNPNPRSSFVTRAAPNSSPNTNLPEERRSLAVATGEIFLNFASFLIKNSAYSDRRVGPVVPGAEALNETRDKVGVRSVVWEQREKDVEAERERRIVTSPGFSFSAAGLLFPYHLGVSRLLLEKGYIKETTPLAGSSAGAIVCAVIASGHSMEDALQLTKNLADNCRTKGTAFRLGAVLRDVLEEFLPEDVHIRSNGRIRVAITQLGWRPRGLLVDQFDSKEDLINAVFTSSFIPGYLAPRPATMYRKRLCIDGGLTLFMPPTSAPETVRVCAFPASRIGLQGIGISPDCNPENRASPRQLFNWALEPADEYILDKLYELGYLDAAVWAEQNPVESTVRDEGSLVIN